MQNRSGDRQKFIMHFNSFDHLTKFRCARCYFELELKSLIGLEDTILALIDDIDVGVENFTFPDFLIFVSQRKKGNGALKLFEEYDTGKIL